FKYQPSKVLRGTVSDLARTSLALTVLDGVAVPRKGVEYLFFIKNGEIIKVVPATEEDSREVKRVLAHRDFTLNRTDRRLHGSKISLEKAVKLSDVIEVATIRMVSVGTTAASMTGIPKIELRVSELLNAGNGPVQTCGLAVFIDEEIPRSDEAYICFINN